MSPKPNQRFDMTAIEKFKFSLSFDDADNVIRSSGSDDEHYSLGKKKKKKEEEAPPPPPAIYTEEQAAQMVAEAEAAAREAADAEGFARGLEQGHAEIRSSLEQAMADTSARLAETLARIDEQQKRANARINEDAIHVAIGVMRKIAPAWSKQFELTEIESIVRQCLANLFDAPKVIVQVHPDISHMVSESVEKIAQSRGFSGKVGVVGEPDIDLGDCHVSWGDGTAVRDTKRIWAEINDIVERALQGHGEEYELDGSDMGDPVIQDTSLADLPPKQPPARSEVPTSDPEPAPGNRLDAEGTGSHDTTVSTGQTEEGHGTERVNMPTSPQDDASHTEIGINDKDDQLQQDGDPLQPDHKPDVENETKVDVTQEAQGPGDENGR
ncbi:MAG: hypothetical protein CMO06_21855 [Thalassospira sp.]|nr:hypothetical protein [Thalassospira sp.]